MMTKTDHVPVLLKEVLEEIQPDESKKIIDATLGFGGHTKAFIDQGAEVLSLEWDPEVLAITKKRLSNYCPGASYKLVKANFANLASVAKQEDFSPVDAVLFDLGISQWHYQQAERGFSFADDQLDMRLNPELETKALDIINNYTEQELDELFTKLVQEKFAGEIAQALVSARNVKEIKSANRLAKIVSQVYERAGERPKYHPATKVFLGLRIVINKELENLKQGLEQAWQILKPNGKLLVITFHSTEARIVKFFGQDKEDDGELKRDKIILPSRQEIEQNPSSRSAQLRVFIKK
jgi:16S rRNA (cytosine1402-N4)-methyltransferase